MEDAFFWKRQKAYSREDGYSEGATEILRRYCWEKLSQEWSIQRRITGTGNTPAMTGPLTRQSRAK